MARAHQLAPHRGAAAIGLGRCLGIGGERQNKMKRSNCWSLFTVTTPKLDASVLRELTILWTICDRGSTSRAPGGESVLAESETAVLPAMKSVSRRRPACLPIVHLDCA